MIIRDIVERESSNPSEPTPTPVPPRPPVGLSKAGFPLAAHRSTRPVQLPKAPSAFAKARKDEVFKRDGGLAVGEGRLVDSVPRVQSVDATRPLSEGDEVRRAVDKENTLRVESMDAAERQEEVQELKERFGENVVDLMRRRRQAREATSSTRPQAGPSKAAIATTSMPTGSAEVSETEKIRGEVTAANQRQVESMSSVERAEEVQELEERFGSRVLNLLRQRAESRKQPGSTLHQAVTQSLAPAAIPLPDATSSSTPTLTPEPLCQTSTASRRLEDTSPQELREKYFQDVPSEDSKLEWMLPSSSSTTEKADTSPRFDLSGRVLSPEIAAELPTNLGLHHHGTSPDLAGYTIPDIIYLCRSTVPSQRITMMGILAKINANYIIAEGAEKGSALVPGTTEASVAACREYDIVTKGITLGLEVISSLVRSVGVLRAGVDLLFESLGGHQWTWFDQLATVPFRTDAGASNDGEPTGIALVAFDEIVSRLSEILSMDGGLPDRTIQQLVLILRRAALHSNEMCETICPLVPVVVKNHVLRQAWPLDPARLPSLDALRLLRDVTISSRECAVALASMTVYEPLLKFIAVAVVSDDDNGLSHEIVLEVLRIFYSLGRYGLVASIATSARDVWLQLGRWVGDQCQAPTAASPLAQAVTEAYFDCIRIWTICAIDPHRTTPEHDLTWAHVSAMGWTDEILSAARALLAHPNRWSELASALEALVAIVNGAHINGVRQGEEEKREVMTALKDMKLAGTLPQAIVDIPIGDQRTPFIVALTAVFQLHNALKSTPEHALTLLESPSLERLLWWFVATTSSSSSADVHLRHVLLQTARREKVLDAGQWATSAFDLVLNYTQGDEPLALDLVDDILRADWSSVAGANDIISSIGHRDKLQILRPLLHHSVLPELESILGPTIPSHLYLKATSTLRPSSELAVISTGKGPGGLPLGADWIYVPLDELLQSGSSAALAQAPPDWDAGERELVRATLALARLHAVAASLTTPRSLLIFNLMKVFMLEHGQQHEPNADSDIFRDPAVAASIAALLATTTSTLSDSTTSHPAVPVAGPLEAVARPFLGEGVPFYQFYTDFLALYEGISFSDPLFTRLLLPPLAMTYPVDYRKLFWAEQPGSLRSARVEDDDVPLESGSVGVFYHPIEIDPDVLAGYARALVKTWVRLETSPFLFRIAIHHLAGVFWRGIATDRQSPRVTLLVVILGSATDSVIRAIMDHDIDSPYGSAVAAEEIARRVELVVQLTGPRGAQRLAAAGYR